MNVNLKTKNFKLTEGVEAYLNEKIETLERFIDQDLLMRGSDSVTADAELALVSRHHHKGTIFRAEVNLHLGGKLLRAEAEADDILAAIDEMKDELAMELRRHKEKQESVFKKGARTIKSIFRKQGDNTK